MTKENYCWLLGNFWMGIGWCVQDRTYGIAAAIISILYFLTSLALNVLDVRDAKAQAKDSP